MGNAHAHIKKKNFQTDGQKIMQLAEALRPHIAELAEGCKNSDGLPVQPATIRAISLDVAQNLIKKAA